jgi:hypothetical protein
MAFLLKLHHRPMLIVAYHHSPEARILCHGSSVVGVLPSQDLVNIICSYLVLRERDAEMATNGKSVIHAGCQLIFGGVFLMALLSNFLSHGSDVLWSNLLESVDIWQGQTSA